MYQVSAYVGKPKWCTRSHTHTHTLTPHTHELYVSRSIPSPEGPFYDPEHGRHHLFFGVYPAVGHGPSASDEDGYRCLSDPRPPFFFTPPTHAAHKHTLADANVTRTASLPLPLPLPLPPSLSLSLSLSCLAPVLISRIAHHAPLGGFYVYFRSVGTACWVSMRPSRVSGKVLAACCINRRDGSLAATP